MATFHIIWDFQSGLLRTPPLRSCFPSFTATCVDCGYVAEVMQLLLALLIRTPFDVIISFWPVWPEIRSKVVCKYK